MDRSKGKLGLDDIVVIRDGNPSDILNIAKLEEETFSMPWSAESIEHDISSNKNANIVCAEIDGEFAGYANIWCIAGEGQLNNIAVSTKYRGRHVGLRIMKKLEQIVLSEDCTTIVLEVRASNIPAISLYGKLGYEEIGRRKGYYLDNGEDAIIMEKNLDK